MSGMSWMSVAGKRREDVLAELGLVDSSESAAAGGVAVAGAMSPDGAVILAFNEFWPAMVQPASIGQLTGECLVVGCSQFDNVNTSLAFLFRTGKPLWTVSHVLDEGALHLDIEGTPPRALTGLMAAARQRFEKDGHDAVFSVPGALAEQVSGFTWARRHELRFTRLDASPQVAAPLSPQQLEAEIRACVAGLAQAEGFQRVRPDELISFVRNTAEERVDLHVLCYIDDSGGVEFDARLTICNHHVQSFMDELPGISATETARLMLSALMSLPYRVRTPAELAALLKSLQRDFVPALRRVCSIKELDRLVNDGKPRFNVMNQPTSSHYEFITGFSRIVLAYLASNKNFDRMVRETAEGTNGEADPSHMVHHVAAQLRKRGVRVK
jgi:hypothetical protein